jgi:tubulin polyglutamylase TTLL6/13
VKPEALSQGKGIYILKKNELNQLKNCEEHMVVQKYIKSPYLIDDFKFDLRIYVLVTNVYPLRIFLYEDGLARFASEKYRTKAFNNPFIHLTNYAINKDNANYTTDKQEEATIGMKRGLKSVYSQMAQDGFDVAGIKLKISDMIVKTLISIQPDLVHHYRTSQPNDIFNNMCFEILGFDVLIDSEGEPWLLEVNHAPSFNVDTPLDAKVKRDLVKDTFRILNVSLAERNEINTLLKQVYE